MVTYTIRKIPQKELRDYTGMNRSAAIAFNFHPRPIDRTVDISHALPPPEGEQVGKHEVVEDVMMRRGMKYFPSHTIALREQEKSWDQIRKDLHLKTLRILHK